MADEKWLIDAKPLMQSGWHLVRTGESNKFLASMSLADVPAVDAVAVVRCKDCKHYFHYGDGVYGCRTSGMMKTEHDLFCSHGERKDNENP